MDRQVSGNIVPMSRSMSDRLRLKMCGAEISRAATRQPNELSGALQCSVLSIVNARYITARACIVVAV